MDVFQVLGYFLSPACAALVGALVAVVKKNKANDEKFREEHAFLLEGMKSNMRSELFRIHTEYVQAGKPVPFDVKEHATSVYRVYAGLGGNGTGTHLWSEIMSAKVARQPCYKEVD